MNIVLHLVAKDFVMLRRRLVVWWLALAAKYGVGFYLVLAADVRAIDFAAWQGGLMSFVGLDVALTLLLAGLLVQADSPMAPAPFWVTRPISRATVLIAKAAAGLLLLVVPPVLLGLPWWWWCARTRAGSGWWSR